jgi:hypothetical protein
MSGFTFLEVAIGLALIYFMLSLLVTIINERISGWLSWRQNMLRSSIENLVGRDLANKIYAHSLIQGLSEKGTPSYIPSSTFARCLIQVVANPKQGQRVTVADIISGIEALPDEKAARLLRVFVQQEEVSVTSFRVEIERWFEDAMDRISGWYKRRIRRLGTIVGLAVACFFNADTFHMGAQLWRDPAVRAAVVQQGDRALASCSSLERPEECEAWKNHETILQELHTLPVGWIGKNPEGWRWIIRLAGWLVTAIAISSGAPFWFDLINRLSDLRAAGMKPRRKSDQDIESERTGQAEAVG